MRRICCTEKNIETEKWSAVDSSQNSQDLFPVLLNVMEKLSKLFRCHTLNIFKNPRFSGAILCSQFSGASFCPTISRVSLLTLAIQQNNISSHLDNFKMPITYSMMQCSEFNFVKFVQLFATTTIFDEVFLQDCDITITCSLLIQRELIRYYLILLILGLLAQNDIGLSFLGQILMNCLFYFKQDPKVILVLTKFHS